MLWRVYSTLEPFGEDRADLRMAILASTTASQWSKRGVPPIRFLKLLPGRESGAVRRRPVGEAQFQAFKQQAIAIGKAAEERAAGGAGR